jgi:hypothetical protein
MLYKDGKEITGIYAGNKPIVAVYKGAALVWQAIRSCFGAGYWINKFPWVNSDAWRN